MAGKPRGKGKATERITLLVTKEEFEAFKKYVDDQNPPMQSFVLRRLLNKVIPKINAF